MDRTQRPTSILDTLGEEIVRIVTPVSACMFLVVILVSILSADDSFSSPSQSISSIATIVYDEGSSSSDSLWDKLEGALLNSLLFVAVVTVVTFFLMYKIPEILHGVFRLNCSGVYGRLLVELAISRDEDIPALVYEARPIVDESGLRDGVSQRRWRRETVNGDQIGNQALTVNSEVVVNSTVENRNVELSAPLIEQRFEQHLVSDESIAVEGIGLGSTGAIKLGLEVKFLSLSLRAVLLEEPEPEPDSSKSKGTTGPQVERLSSIERRLTAIRQPDTVSLPSSSSTLDSCLVNWLPVTRKSDPTGPWRSKLTMLVYAGRVLRWWILPAGKGSIAGSERIKSPNSKNVALAEEPSLVVSS
ncbi:hypothetical protein V2J09_020444 [Rumex salicifolius]